MVRRSFKESSQGEMALIIDVQSFDRMSREDAQAYADKLGTAIEDLRARNVPVTWATMSDRNQLYKPAAGAGSQVRDMQELIDTMSFYGAKPENANSDIMRKFLAEHGPHENEAVYCKYFKNAFTEPGDAAGRPDYRKILEAETGKPFSATQKAFQHGEPLTGYMRNQGIRNTIIMGTVSSHCIAESGVGAIVKGFSSTVISDLVLSWEGDENKVNPQTSDLRWRAGAAAANPDRFHESKIRERLAKIIGEKQARDLSDSEVSAIRRMALESYEERARTLPPRREASTPSNSTPAPGAPAIQPG